jgi:hypothetical protein
VGEAGSDLVMENRVIITDTGRTASRVTRLVDE